MEETETWEPEIDYEALSHDIFNVCTKLCRDTDTYNSIMNPDQDDNLTDTGAIFGTMLYNFAIILLHEQIKEQYGEPSGDLYFNELEMADKFSLTLMSSKSNMLKMIQDKSSNSDELAEKLLELPKALDVDKRIEEIKDIISQASLPT